MKKISLCIIALFSCVSLNGYTLAPGEYPSAYVHGVQSNLESVVERHQEQDAVLAVLGQAVLLDKLVPLSRIKKLLEQLEALKPEGVTGEQLQDAQLGALHKLIVPLIVQTTQLIFAQLEELDELLVFWKEADRQYVSYVYHQKSPHFIISKLEGMQAELHAHLGTLIMHTNTVPFGAPSSQQFEWIGATCSLLRNAVPRQKVLEADHTFDGSLFLISKTMDSIARFPQRWAERISQYRVPSFLRRHLVSLGATVGAGALAAPWAHKNQKEIKKNGGKAVQKVVNVGKRQYELTRSALSAEHEKKQQLGEERDRLLQEIKLHRCRELLRFSHNKEDRTEAMIYILCYGSHRNEDDVRHVKALHTSSADAHGAAGAAAAAAEGQQADIEMQLPGLLEAHYRDQITTDSDFVRKAFETAIPKKDAIPSPRQVGVSAATAAAAASTEAERTPMTMKQIHGMSKVTIADLLDLAHVQFTDFKGELKGAGVSLQPIFDKLGELAGASSIVGGLRTAFFGKSEAPARGSAAGAEGRAEKDHAQRCVKTLMALLDTGQLTYRVGRHRWADYNLKYRWAKAVGYGVVAGIPVYAAIKLCSKVAGRFKVQKTHDELFEVLRELKKLFLVNGDRQQSEMDPQDVGLMYHLLEKIERQPVPKKYRRAFLRDVRLIQRPDLAADKKYELINVLQDGYPFFTACAPDA